MIEVDPIVEELYKQNAEIFIEITSSGLIRRWKVVTSDSTGMIHTIKDFWTRKQAFKHLDEVIEFYANYFEVG